MISAIISILIETYQPVGFLKSVKFYGENLFFASVSRVADFLKKGQ